MHFIVSFIMFIFKLLAGFVSEVVRLVSCVYVCALSGSAKYLLVYRETIPGRTSFLAPVCFYIFQQF
jgi:hypothetical protein